MFRLNLTVLGLSLGMLWWTAPASAGIIDLDDFTVGQEAFTGGLASAPTSVSNANPTFPNPFNGGTITRTLTANLTASSGNIGIASSLGTLAYTSGINATGNASVEYFGFAPQDFTGGVFSSSVVTADAEANTTPFTLSLTLTSENGSATQSLLFLGLANGNQFAFDDFSNTMGSFDITGVNQILFAINPMGSAVDIDFSPFVLNIPDEAPPIPEPTSLALFAGMGMAGAWYARRRRTVAAA